MYLAMTFVIPGWLCIRKVDFAIVVENDRSGSYFMGVLRKHL